VSAPGIAPVEGPAEGALELRAVSKAYETASGALPAVEEATMTIAPAEFRVIVGPSGCGKTTLLNAIAGFHHITGGEIRLDGEVLCDAASPQATPGADRVVVFQHSTLFPWRTVLDNVAYGPVVQGRLSRREARELARERLDQAGLAELSDLYPRTLSSGNQRSVEIVRALVNEPKVLLLDEPFRGMDAITRGIAHEALLELYDRARTTVFFITHDIDEAVLLGSRVSVLSSRPGRVKATVDIDLPRPRDVEVLAGRRFAELVAEVLELVHGEAAAAFEPAGQAVA
jgi:NitT/TauT family transport system ATP-binding protein